MTRSYRFYKDGLGFPTTCTPDKGIVFFQTNGTCLAIYPKDKLADDVGEKYTHDMYAEKQFSGVTLAHITRRKEKVDEVLARAKKAGGRIEKTAQDNFWGGYSGYFSDPDGHLWEVAYADFWKFDEIGNLVIE